MAEAASRPTPPRRSSIPLLRRLHWLVFGAILAGTALALLFTTFMVYDDEGYVLFSLKTFVEGGGLYERVYSQYGPFFFIFNQILHLGGAGLDFTNTSARLLTGFYWLATVWLCGAMVWRLTRSNVATVSAVAGVFLHLWPMTSEPSHPGGFITFLVAVAAWAGVAWQSRPRILAITVGLIGAALSLTKINVGVFLLAGAGAWWVIHLDAPRLSLRWRVWIIGAAMALLPFALMRKQLGLEWVGIFAVVSAAAETATVLAAGAGAAARVRWSDATWLIGAAAALAGLTAIAVMAQHTSAGGLLEGVLLGPLRHPQNYLAPVNWRTGAVPLAIASLAMASLAVARRSWFPAGLLETARMVAALLYLATWLFEGAILPHAFVMSYALAATWLFVIPLGTDGGSQPARAWLGLLMLPQALHAFPVAGSQISWGTFLWIPLAVIGAHEAYRAVALRSPRGQRACAFVATALLLALTGRCLQSAQLAITRVRESDRLALPGANSLLLPEGLSTAVRTLSRNAVMHADVLFSMPGMDSFHLWTDVPPPTTINATHWFTLLSPTQQEDIRLKLAASPRSCVIVQRDVLDFLVRQHIATDSPLALWLRDNYEPAFKVQTYEFWVRKGRTIAPVNTATAFEGASGTSPRYQVSVILAETGLRDVTSIELGRIDNDVSTTAATWTAADAQVLVTPLNSAGRETGPMRVATFPIAIDGLVRLDVRTDHLPTNFPFGHGVIYLRDSQGRRVAEARFIR